MPYYRSLARSAFVRQLRACCDCGKRSTKEAALDIGLILKSAVMGVVEGLTEFLPVSSTGHLILAGALLNFDGQNVKVFEIAIQAGAIFAVMWQYRERLLRTVAGITRDRTSRRFAFNLLIAFLPAACVGLLLGSFIKATLFQPLPVAAAFIVGGFIILWVERRQRRIIGGAGSCRYRVQSIDEITWADALKIGLAQCLALIPGTSRSGATIIGAMIFGYFLTITESTQHLIGYIGGLPVDRWWIMIAIVVLYLILGCVMDQVAIILVTLPMVFPLIMHLGFDPIWFGVICTKTAEIGMASPPVGMNAFVVSATTKIPLEDVFKGTWPLLAMDVVSLGVLLAFPLLSTWLPSTMVG